MVLGEVLVKINKIAYKCVVYAGGSVISRNLKSGGGGVIDKCLGGVNMRKELIYIKKH